MKKQSRQVERRIKREQDKQIKKGIDHYFTSKEVDTEEGVQKIGKYLQKVADTLPPVKIGGKPTDHFQWLKHEWINGFDKDKPLDQSVCKANITQYCNRIINFQKQADEQKKD